MTEKIVKVGDQEVTFRSSAAMPRLYRIKFGRDIFKDFSKLTKSYTGKKKNDESFSIEDLEIFENVAYIMARQADNSVPEDVGEWLDQFEMFSIIEIMPEILEMWGMNMETTADSKKKLEAVAGK